MSSRPQDPWSGYHLGFYSSLSAIDRTHRKGTRSYAASGYLAPNLGRSNLSVLCEATACSLIMDGTTVKGLRFIQGTRHYEVSVTKGVIVSCGVVGSPQLLELSGIGDPDVLRVAGVECLAENRGVGANFQDHVVSVVSYEMAPGNMSMDSLQKP